MLAQFTPELEEQQAANAAELFLQRHRAKLALLEDESLDFKARLAVRNKIYAAAGRFMAARGFSSEYMQVFWEKLQVNTDI